MIKNYQKQSGSALVVVIVIAVVAILGALGYVIWNNFFGSINTETEQVVTQPNTPSDNVSDENILTINNWGIQFAISDSLQSTKVMYNERSTNDEPPRNYYAFTTERIQRLGGKCAERQFGDTVIVYRYTEKPIATPDGELINEEAIGGYYYVLTSPIAACSGFNENDQMIEPSQVEIDDRAALKDSIRTLTSLV
jgi:hypothetical protein